MTDDVLDAAEALSLILDEENAQLSDPGFAPVPEALVAAKLRHVGVIEAAGLRLTEAQAPVESAMAARLRALLPEILAKVEVNGGLLRRRIALCDDLMGAIAADARRRAGGRSMIYGAQGVLSRTDQATPIAINSRV